MDTTVGVHSVHQVLVEGQHLSKQVSKTPRHPTNEKRGRNSIRSPHQVLSPTNRSTIAGRSYSPPKVFETRSTTRSASPELIGRASQRQKNLERVSKLRASKKEADSFVEAGDCSVSVPVRTSQLQLLSLETTSPASTIHSAVKGEKELHNRTFFSENNEPSKSLSISQSDHPFLESILNKENFQTSQQYQRSNLKRFSAPSKAAISQGEHLETSSILLKSAPQRFSSIQKMKQHQQHQVPTTSRIRSRRSFSRERETSNSRDEAIRFYSNPVSPASDDEQEGDLVRCRYDSDDSLDDDLLVPSFRVSSLRSGGSSARRRSSRRVEALSTSILSSSITPNGIHYSLSSSSLSKYSTPQKTGISSDTTTNELLNGDNHHNYGVSKTFPTGGNVSGTPSSAIGNSMNSTSSVSPPPSGIGQGSIHNHLQNSNNRRHTMSFFHSRQKQQNRNWLTVCLHSVVNNVHDQFFGPSTIVISPRFKIRQGSRTWTGFITLVTSVFILSYFGAYLHTFYQTSKIVYQGTNTRDITQLRFVPGTTNTSLSPSWMDSQGVFGSLMYIFSRTGDFDHQFTKHATTHETSVILDNNLQRGNNTTVTSLIHGTSLLANLKRPHDQTNTYTESLENVRKVIQNVQLINSADVGSVDDQIHDYVMEKDKGSAKIKENVGNADTTIARLRRPYDKSRKQSGSIRPEQPIKTQHESLQQIKGSGINRPDEPSARTADFDGLRSEDMISKTNLRRGRRSHNAFNVTKINQFTPTSPPKDNNTITDTRSLEFGRFSNNAPSCGQVLEDEISFTLVTQMSLNRLWMMKHHCERWIFASGDSHQFQGRISIAVYVGKNTSQTSETILGQLVDSGCPYDATSVQTISGYSDEEYPVNALRNLALSAVKTSHVVYVDVDFWVSSDLHQNLLHHRDFLSNHPKSAMVIPAFQLNRQCRDYRECPEKNVPKMPATRDDLVMLMVHGKASTFDPTNRGGHSSTRYRDWYEYQTLDELLPIECVNSNRYEPYLVFRYCHDLPPFQEVFTGYGKNKMTWIMQLRYAGYDFHQIGGSFVVHYPHLESSARLKWNGGKDGKQLRKPKIDSGLVNSTTTAASGELEAIELLQQKYKRAQIDHTFIEFRSWLEQEYGHPDDKRSMIRTPKCQDAMNDDEKLWAR